MNIMETDLKQKYRLRVDNCIGTIIEVHKNTRARDENETFLSEFEKLRANAYNAHKRVTPLHSNNYRAQAGYLTL